MQRRGCFLPSTARYQDLNISHGICLPPPRSRQPCPFVFDTTTYTLQGPAGARASAVQRTRIPL